MDFASLEQFANSALDFLGVYGFLIVIIFGVVHPLIENPLSLFNLTLAIAILGIPLGYLVVFLSNLVGIVLLYLIAIKFNKKTDNYLFKKKISNKALMWIRETPTWKHIVVIGVPMIPTYPIKLAVPFTENIPNYVSFILLTILVLYIYFGKYLFNNNKQIEEVI
jgi:hypothetical protein